MELREVLQMARVDEGKITVFLIKKNIGIINVNNRRKEHFNYKVQEFGATNDGDLDIYITE